MSFSNIRDHPGYTGGFTTDVAEGCWPNGTRVVKMMTEEGDLSPVGAQGIVLGSLSDTEHPEFTLYFIEWDDHPKLAVAVAAIKLSPVIG